MPSGHVIFIQDCNGGLFSLSLVLLFGVGFLVFVFLLFCCLFVGLGGGVFVCLFVCFLSSCNEVSYT